LKSKRQFTFRYQNSKPRALPPLFNVPLHSSSFRTGEFVVQVLLTPTHLAIVMEYAAGGELFERICTNGRFSEDEARIAQNKTFFRF